MLPAIDPNPLVSVIIPVYQGEKTIVHTVESVLQQTYQRLEIIVVNDGSTDTTSEVLSQLSDWRVRVIHQENAGVAEARNTGIREARGEYLAFLDADDAWLPDFLETNIKTISDSKTPVSLAYSGYCGLDENKKPINFPKIHNASGNIFKQVLESEGVLLPSTVVMHREILKEMGGFSQNSYHEDRVFFIRATQKFPAYATGKRLVLYSQTLSGRCRKILADYDTALDAECSIADALRYDLPQADLVQLQRLQMRNLMNRFLMYGYLNHAKKLYPQVDKSLLQEGLKNRLAHFSIKTGINWLYIARKTTQAVTKLYVK